MIRTEKQLKVAREKRDYNTSHPVEVSQQKRAQWIKNNRIQ